MARLKKNPWNRALRIDKFTIAALEATLYAYEAGTARETIPTLRALTEPLGDVRRARPPTARTPGSGRPARAWPPTWWRTMPRSAAARCPRWSCPPSASRSAPPRPPPRALDVALRTGDPPIVGRMLDDRLFLDCRTVLPHQIPALAAALAHAALPIASS